MWNEAFSVGGPTCTVQQFETMTGVFIDHIVVVNFAGFEDMVNAIGGVPVCIPEDIVDPEHGINIPAGTREIEGREALNYVRARYTLGNGSDIGRIKRQQAFIAAMAEKVISADTLARVDKLVRFLNAATKSLTVDEDLESVIEIAKIGVSFQGIGLGNIQFLPCRTPTTRRLRLRGPGLLEKSARRLWEQLANDEPLDKKFTGDAISAGKLPGQGNKPQDARADRGGPAAGRGGRALRVSGPDSERDRLRSAERPARRGLRRRAARDDQRRARARRTPRRRTDPSEAWLRAQVPPHHG